MFPAQLDESTDSPAEKKLFPLLRDHLSDDFTVFHGQALQAVRRNGGIDDREIDFLVAHPEHGLLAIEVKGGRITVNGQNQTWFQNDKPLKRSPIKQVKQATYDLLEYLKNQQETLPYSYPIWYAVCFPDVDVPGNLAPDAPRQIILDKRDVLPEKLQAHIASIYNHYQRSGAAGPKASGMIALVNLLAPSHVLRSVLAKDFETEEEQIKVLTEEQYEVLDEFERSPRLLVTGCAGSGKTLLALEKTRRLLEQGQSVLFTCYNRQLAQWLQEIFPAHAKLKLTTFHNLCKEICKEAGRELGDYGDHFDKLGVSRSDYFNAVMPNALYEAVNQLEKRFDAIIVDEAQDFHRTYWLPLRALLRDPDSSHFYIFSDENQSLYGRDALPFTEPAKHLSRNLRNTKEIGELVGRYHTSASRYKAAGPLAHRAVEVVNPRDYASSDEALKSILDRLLEQGIKPGQIIVLTPLNEKSHWKQGTQLGRYRLVRNTATQPMDIRVDTIYAFKGQERAVVILTEMDRPTPTELDRLLYVALSRARNHVVVLGKLPDPSKSSAT
jgi:superfamily I DNA/RNA helicase